MSGKNFLVREENIKRPGSGRKLINALFFIGIIIGITAAGYFLFLPKKESYSLGSYRYAVVKRENIINSIQASGILVVSKKQIILAPQSGIIKSIMISEGDSVEKNEQLAVIYSQELEDKLNEVETGLTKKSRSRNNLIMQFRQKEEQINRYLKKLEEKETTWYENYMSYKRLYNAGAATKKELEAAREEWKSAQDDVSEYRINSQATLSNYKVSIGNLEADIKTLKEQLEYIREQISKCKISSPFSGDILQIYKTPGEYVSQFSKLVTIADLSSPVVVLKVPEHEINSIKKNQKVILSLGSKNYDGFVTRIAVKAVEGSGNYGSTIDVEIAFIKAPDRVIPGSSVSAVVFTGVKKNVLCLPRGAYLASGSERYVYRIENTKAEKTEVDFGTMTDMKIEILGGLNEGDAVIISGYQDYINLDEINLELKGGKEID